MNKRKIIIIISILFIIIGVGFISFPTISNFFYEQRVKKDKEEFVSKTQNVQDEYNLDILDALYMKLQAENNKLYEEKQRDLVDPFSYQQTAIDLSVYGIEDNVIGYLNIPRLNVDLPIILGANTENMSKGAVHLTQTSYPIGGNNTNCVIAAHRGYGKADMFRNIQKIEYGDRIYIQNFRELLVYEVYDLKVVTPDNKDELMIEEGKDIVTLITCHPYRHNYQRYIVKAQRVYEE